MKTVLVTGSSGLVGSACVRHFHSLGWQVVGLDNNARKGFFGDEGDTMPALLRLKRDCPGFHHYPGDIQAKGGVNLVVCQAKPDLVIHAAAQPSHDYAATHPLEDFHINAGGTLNLLEAVRRNVPEAVFCFLSTNKVYGDAPNELPLKEGSTRYDYGYLRSTACDSFGDTIDLDDGGADPDYGINENMRLDQSTHSLFGASKLAADIYTQEYGRNFGLKTVCFRCGCLTGAAHAATEQHGFLAYLARCCREGRTYRVYGYKGKQVRDNLHAFDVARACEEFAAKPRAGQVYNLGGGRENSVSVLEAIVLFEQATGKRLQWEYIDQPRTGDHICYISDTQKFRYDYPGWSVTRSLADIIAELATS